MSKRTNKDTSESVSHETLCNHTFIVHTWNFDTKQQTIQKIMCQKCLLIMDKEEIGKYYKDSASDIS